MKFKQSPPGFRNVRGPIVQKIQANLKSAGFDLGAVDGIWGGNTIKALKAWQSSLGQPATAEVDAAAWQLLTREAVPEILTRALQLTGDWEGTGYGGANGNFDGQGITWGVVGFTWANGELQSILNEIHETFPETFSRAFGGLEARMLNVLGEPRNEQMAFARDISVGNGERIEPQWAAAFQALGAASEVQAIENRLARDRYWNAALALIHEFGLQSDAGMALCFDVTVQNTVTGEMKATIHQQSDGKSEKDKLTAIAQVVAAHSKPQYQQDVLMRKMAFVDGQGKVHGDSYDVTCWGIS